MTPTPFDWIGAVGALALFIIILWSMCYVAWWAGWTRGHRIGLEEARREAVRAAQEGGGDGR